MMNDRGFTLAELLVVIAVLGLILAGVFNLQQQGQQAYVMSANRVDAQQNGRVALTLMTRELRTACAIASTPAPTATSIQFTIVDPTVSPSLDCNSAPASNVLTLQYSLSGSTLNRTVGATTTPLIGGVAGVTFQGYDSANATTMTPGTSCGAGVICSVDIALTTMGEQSVASYSVGNVRITVEDRVRLRNM